ncbi:MAG TPA: cupin domain-containing protein [Solirubrobacteraceae bacterium]|nr:cupin domain-containing protein [Solirubrobacteraceae bacterium]
MAHAGQEIHGSDGFRLRFVRTAAETGGGSLEMEATYSGSGSLPPEHVHPRQVERFEVLDGTIRAIMGGTERQYAAGETFEVPAGTPHQMTAEGPSRVRWEMRPALRTAEVFERLHGGRDAGARAEASIAEFLAEFSDEIRITGA